MGASNKQSRKAKYVVLFSTSCLGLKYLVSLLRGGLFLVRIKNKKLFNNKGDGNFSPSVYQKA
jgi:hypothetical protein